MTQYRSAVVPESSSEVFAMERAAIESMVREKWKQYPVLRQHPTYLDMVAVAAAEGVSVRMGRLPYGAQLVQFGGEWTILLDERASRSQRAFFIVHELGHLWLHHDPCAERGERLFTFLADDTHDPREADVDLFVCFVLGILPMNQPLAREGVIAREQREAQALGV